MKLYIPLPGCLKFRKIFDGNEYLQRVLEADSGSISLWYISEGCDMAELKRILVGNNIKYRIE